jgi:hypothetical protein
MWWSPSERDPADTGILVAQAIERMLGGYRDHIAEPSAAGVLLVPAVFHPLLNRPALDETEAPATAGSP